VRLGGGVSVPYPEPVDAAATNVGRGNRKRDTKPEVRLRSALHRRGLRFRKDHPLRLGTVRVRPDIVFTRGKVAVFVDGCFWHSCPDHGRRPGRNLDYWIPKLDNNVARDRRVDAALDAEGWDVVRIWEHEDVETSAARIAAVLDRRRRGQRPPAR
jgi:DNA mismatch endonuclease (patch repair protein)